MEKKVLNKFESRASEILYLNEELADVSFVFNNGSDDVKKVPGNRAILAALSPVFRAMFFGVMKEIGDVNIVDANPDAFKEFLQLFYLDKVTLTMDNIREVVKLADKYDMSRYVNNCTEFFDHQLISDEIYWGQQLTISTDKHGLKQSWEHPNLKPQSKLEWNNDQKIKFVQESIQEQHPLKCGTQRTEPIWFSSQRKTLWVDKRTWRKRNVDEMCKWIATQKGLDNLKKCYDQINGLPEPINEGLWLRNCFDAVAMRNGLADVYYAPEYSHYHLIGPNPSYYPYSDVEQGRKRWKCVKNNEEGFGLLLWVVHPEQIKGTMFDEDNRKELIMGSKKIDILLDQLENIQNNIERTKDQEKIESIRNRSDIPYFASVLDLKPEHLELVKIWKRDMSATLRNFDVSEEEGDNVRIYFHWPYADDSVTLHIHARVNQGSHPLEERESITIDKVIETLQQRKCVEEFILEKSVWFTTPEDYHFLSQIDGVRAEIVRNRFKLESREVPNPSYTVQRKVVEEAMLQVDEVVQV